MVEVLRDAQPLSELSRSCTKRHEKPDVESKNDTAARGSQTMERHSQTLVSRKRWGSCASGDAGLL